METSVQVQINAIDNSKAAFASLSKNLEGVQKVSQSTGEKLAALQPTFQKMALAGTAAFAGIVAGAKSSINAYAEVERAQRQLSNAVIGVSKGTKEQLEQINALTGALEKKAGVDADSLTMGVAQLSTFGLSTDAVLNLTKSLADLTVNQDGVNAGSEAYISNANVIAKALNGQFGILEKSGIRFTEAQKSLIEFGTESEKVAAINEGLAQNLRETTDTIDGIDLANAKAARSFENISENLGKALAPAFAELAAKVTPVIEKFAAWAEANPELLSKIVLISGALAALIAVLGTIGLILPPLIVAWTFFFGTAAVSATATTAAVAGTTGAFAALGATLAAVTLPMVLIGVAIAAVVAGIYLLYKNWDEVMAFITTSTTVAWGAVTGAFNTAMTAVTGAVSTMWGIIKDVFFTSINFVIGVIATLLDYLLPNWDGMLMAMFTKLSEVFSLITGYLGEQLNTLTGILSGWFEAFAGVWRSVWESLKTTFDEVWTALKATFTGVIDGIKAGLETLTAPIEKVISLAQKAIDLAKQVGGGVIKSATSKISDILSRGAGITGKASGGVVSKGTPYIIGERGQEMFVPSENGSIVSNDRLGSMGGGNIVINISGTFMDDRAAAKRLGDELIRTLNKQGRYA